MDLKWRRVEQIAGILFLGFVAIGCAVVLRPFVTAMLWAAILVFATWPVYRRLERLLRGRKNLAAAVMTALIALVLVVPLAVVGLTFADSVARLAQQVQGYTSAGLPPAPEWIRRIPLAGERLSAYWLGVSENADGAAQALRQWIPRATPHLLRWGVSLGQGILQLTLSMFIAFFFYRDGVALAAKVDEGIKRIAGDFSQRVLETAGITVQSVVYGLIGTAIAQGILAGIGFSLAGLPSPILWALLTFLLSLVPAGPPLVWGPATVWLLMKGETGHAVFMGLWGLILISGIDNVVRPALISRGAPLPFALTLLGVMGGLLGFGFIGVFLGPTLLAVGYSLTQEFLKPKTPHPRAEPDR
jgi:predicted PurR-regulated permease PerM